MKKSFILIGLLVFSGLGFGMSIFDAGKSCVFSAVNAKLTIDGTPLAGVTVHRTSDWQKEVKETTTTGDDGSFEFPALYQASASKFVPFSEFVAAQSIVVELEGEEYEIWSNAKREPKEDTELGGKPINITCELNDELRLVEDFGSLLVTNCIW